MECLDANAVQDLMSGALDSTARGAVLGHLDTCEDCRELLAITASDSLGEQVDLLATQAASDPGITLPSAQPTQIGRFAVEERIGAGAMGVVYRAADPTLGRDVAVKLLRRADESLTERLVREARSMAQVNHPNVVTVYEVGQAADGTTFIAMELVKGTSLRPWQSKVRDQRALVGAYIAAGRGLAAAHAAGIVHRDFKPDNVLVGDDGRVRVTDFGLAAAKPGERSSHIGDVNLTTSGSVLGTPAYMAPEQFVGGNVDPRTDQFNFCVALYEALYGERPFAGKTFEELGDNVCLGDVRPPPEGSHVSSALRAILLRGLSVKPGDRFPTMNDLIVELGRDRAKPWRRTSIAAAALAGVLGLGLVADWIVRDRLGAEIRQSFALTGTQLERAVAQLTNQFDTVSAIAYREQALREVAGHHDQADFGLGTPDEDRAGLERLHNTLVATDWVKLGTSQLAIADYKGRLLYTSSAPGEWGTDLKALLPVKRALDAGKGDSITILPYKDPALAGTHILGTAPPGDGLAVLFVRTLALGDKASEQSEARALYMQLVDGSRLLDNVRLDDATALALVAPGGSTGTLSSAIIEAALASSDITEVSDGDRTYQVQARPVRDLDGQGTIAHVVMARPISGVLSLFPGARIVFAIAALASLLVAIATFWRARDITSARI